MVLLLLLFVLQFMVMSGYANLSDEWQEGSKMGHHFVNETSRPLSSRDLQFVSHVMCLFFSV